MKANIHGVYKSKKVRYTIIICNQCKEEIRIGNPFIFGVIPPLRKSIIIDCAFCDKKSFAII